MKKRPHPHTDPPDLGSPAKNRLARNISCDALVAGNQSRSQAKTYIDNVASKGCYGCIPAQDVLDNAKLWVDKWSFTKP